MNFDICIGIDYSGAKTPVARSAALQVYEARCGEKPQAVIAPASTDQLKRNWCRQEIASWLATLAKQDTAFIVGIDHGFSFPKSYFERYLLGTWDQFLADFSRHWPTDQSHVTVDTFRVAASRTGSSKEFRLTETWTSSAKSVFQFDVQGSVAKSTHAGLPWLLQLRNELSDRIHFWPFDGWIPQTGKSVIAEVYPSIFRNRYPRENRTCDQQDAYSVARWLSESSQAGSLDRYFDPPLTDDEREIAKLEGWILGIS